VQLEPYPGRTMASVSADVAHLRTLGITRFYVYDPWELPDGDWAALNDSLTGVQVLAETGNARRAAAAHFNGVYTYDVLRFTGGEFARICAAARRLHIVCAPSVGPGYDASVATRDDRVRPRRDGRTYDGMWRDAIAAKPSRITITSYNEWHEGTQIEPARSAGPPRTTASLPGEARSYRTYNGAYRLHGDASSNAYLVRTAMWIQRFVNGTP
jgi:glycoprotein endo-alpha-1,2-mannosidase